MSGHILVATILGHHVSSLGIYFWVIKYKGKVLGWALLSLEYHIFNFFEIPNVYLILLPPTNEVAGRLCFAGVCDSVHGGGGASVPLHAGIHPQQVHLPPGTPPPRYTPRQVHTPLAGTPPNRYTPWCSVCWDMVKKGAVRIPLECNLITSCNEVVAKVIFLLVSVILLTGGVCLSACWDTTLGADTPPQADTPRSRHPPEQTPPREDPPEQTPQSRPPWEQTPPREQTHPLEQTPPRSRHWNAFLFINVGELYCPCFHSEFTKKYL